MAVEPVLIQGMDVGLTLPIWEPKTVRAAEDDSEDSPQRIYKKIYEDPDQHLKALLAALLLSGLTEKRDLILAHVAENGTDGVLGYAESVLGEGWAMYFPKAAVILGSAATLSTLKVIAESKLDLTPEFIAGVHKQNSLIAKQQAA
jgi:hypothetical protein